jgi:four helix bundle protein
LKESVVHEKAFAFALEMVALYKGLRERHEYDIARQLLRCGTSIGANLEEASAAQSRNDFYAKVTIASKEARETKYWLRLLHESQLVNIDVTKQLAQADELIRLLTAIAKTIGESR